MSIHRGMHKEDRVHAIASNSDGNLRLLLDTASTHLLYFIHQQMLTLFSSLKSVLSPLLHRLHLLSKPLFLSAL